MSQIIFLILFLPLFIKAEGLAISAPTYLNSRSIGGEATSLLVKGLGGSCLALDTIIDSLPCSAALVPQEKDPRLMGSLLISNGFNNLDKARIVLDKKPGLDNVRSLLSGAQPLDIEIQGGVTFFSNKFSAMYLPNQTQLHSNIVGDVNPSVQLFVYSADYLTIQWGTQFTKNFSFGIQAKQTNAKVLNKYFQLLELATEEGAHLLDIKMIKFISYDPSFNYRLDSWKFTYLAHQLGAPKIVELGMAGPDHQVGVGYTFLNDISSGKLDLLLDYKNSMPHFGVKYEYGVLSLVGGLNDYGSSAGAFFFIKKMFSGIVFSNTNLPWKKNEPIKTVYTQFGLQI